MIFLLAACAPALEEKPGDVYPNLPTSDCGTAAHDWLPLTGMGEVLDAEVVDEWALNVDSLRGLAGIAGLVDTSRIRHGARAWRVRYATQDRGVRAEATLLVTLPDAPADDFPSLLYLHPSTGFDDFCAPSGRDLTWAGVPLVLAGLGYAVAAPDYLGQNGFGAEAEEWHPYLAAEPTAVASLDSVRAMWDHATVETGVTPDPTLVIVGASQGGAAGLWAERFAPSYLPEARLAGSVLSVPPFDLVGMAAAAADTLTIASVGVPLTLYTMNDWYGAGADLTQVIQPDLVGRIEDIFRTDCPSAEIPSDITALEDIYTDTWLASADTANLDAWQPWSCFLAESSVGTTPWPRAAEVPKLVLLGGADEVTLIDVQRSTIDTLCAEGEPVVALECEGLGHTETVQATLDDQVDWILARTAGEAVPATCTGVEQRMCGEGG